MTAPQRRLYDAITRATDRGDTTEYWPIVNDWVKDAGPAAALALRNINRTVAALIRDGYISLTDDGLFEVLR